MERSIQPSADRIPTNTEWESKVGTGTSAQAVVTIKNKLGLHARPAMAFVDAANGFRSDIFVSKGAQSVDGKSIMQMMMLAATQGTELKIDATGPDADEAIRTLVELVDNKFDED